MRTLDQTRPGPGGQTLRIVIETALDLPDAPRLVQVVRTHAGRTPVELDFSRAPRIPDHALIALALAVLRQPCGELRTRGLPADSVRLLQRLGIDPDTLREIHGPRTAPRNGGVS